MVVLFTKAAGGVHTSFPGLRAVGLLSTVYVLSLVCWFSVKWKAGAPVSVYSANSARAADGRPADGAATETATGFKKEIRSTGSIPNTARSGLAVDCRGELEHGTEEMIGAAVAHLPCDRAAQEPEVQHGRRTMTVLDNFFDELRRNVPVGGR